MNDQTFKAVERLSSKQMSDMRRMGVTMHGSLILEYKNSSGLEVNWVKALTNSGELPQGKFTSRWTEAESDETIIFSVFTAQDMLKLVPFCLESDGNTYNLELLPSNSQFWDCLYVDRKKNHILFQASAVDQAEVLYSMYKLLCEKGMLPFIEAEYKPGTYCYGESFTSREGKEVDLSIYPTGSRVFIHSGLKSEQGHVVALGFQGSTLVRTYKGQKFYWRGKVREATQEEVKEFLKELSQKGLYL